MTVFLLTLIPVVLYGLWLTIELCRQRRYALSGFAVSYVAATAYYVVFIAHVIVTGEILFPYSDYINRVLSVMLMPSFYWMANITLGYRPSKTQLAITYAPAIAMLLINCIPADIIPGMQPGKHLVYCANISIGMNDMVIGWSIAELFLVCQGMMLIGKALNDYHSHSHTMNRTETGKETIIAYGNIGLVLFVQAFVGCRNWMSIPDYAIADFCLNAFVFAHGLNLIRKCTNEGRHTSSVVPEYHSNFADANPLATADESGAEEQKTAIPPIDYAVAPEIPREDEQTLVTTAPKVEEMSSKDILTLQLRRLIEEDKIYLQAGIRIDEVALTLGTNRTYVAKLMKTVYGHTFSEYMNICRLNSAKSDMLLRKEVSIETIALSNGFNSSNTFNKVFNQHFGASPAAWRRSYTEGKTEQ